MKIDSTKYNPKSTYITPRGFFSFHPKTYTGNSAASKFGYIAIAETLVPTIINRPAAPQRLSSIGISNSNYSSNTAEDVAVQG